MLIDIIVSEVSLGGNVVLTKLKLSSQKLRCPKCKFTSKHRYDFRTVISR